VAIGYPDWGTDTETTGWESEGEKTNPVAATFLALTDSLPMGFYNILFYIAGSASVGTYYNVTHWDATLSNVLHQQIVRVPTAGFLQLQLPGIFKTGAGDRWAVSVRTDIAGTVQASIIYRRVTK